MHQAPRHIVKSLACCIKTENFDASMCHWNHDCNTRKNSMLKGLHSWEITRQINDLLHHHEGTLNRSGCLKYAKHKGTTNYEASYVETKKTLFWDDECSYGLKVIQSDSLVWNLTISYGVQTLHNVTPTSIGQNKIDDHCAIGVFRSAWNYWVSKPQIQ
jgi:hypothetical protein